MATKPPTSYIGFTNHRLPTCHTVHQILPSKFSQPFRSIHGSHPVSVMKIDVILKYLRAPEIILIITWIIIIGLLIIIGYNYS